VFDGLLSVRFRLGENVVLVTEYGIVIQGLEKNEGTSTNLKKTGKVSMYPSPALEIPDMTTGPFQVLNELSVAVKT